MRISLSFLELGEYVAGHYGKKVGFSRVADNEVCVAYAQKVLITTVKIPVNIRFDEVAAHEVTIAYNGGIGIDMIIAGVLAFAKAKLPELSVGVTQLEGRGLRIDFSQLAQTKAIVEKVSLESIQVREDGLEVAIVLK